MDINSLAFIVVLKLLIKNCIYNCVFKRRYLKLKLVPKSLPIFVSRGCITIQNFCNKLIENRVSRRNFSQVGDHNGDSRDLKYLRHNRHITFDLRRNLRYAGPTCRS